MWSTHDLIVARATPAGHGARGIVRLAGAGLSDVLATLLDAPAGWSASGRPSVLSARLAAAGPARDWGPLPVTVLHWPGPGGPLGEPLAELQLPASAPLVDALVAAACRAGARLARGGEFTLRAFLAGRLDLVQAEAVLAVVDARSPDDLAAALDRLAGGAGGALAATRDALLDLLADLEAAIDFADETTPDAVPAAPAWPLVHDRLAACAAAIAAGAAGLARRDAGAGVPPRVVLAGPPNIGKSSLFNALVGRDAALVADEAGTTRDWLEAPLGAPGDGAARCTLVDVAGITAAGPPAAAGTVAVAADARAREEVAGADVVVACADAGAPGTWPAAPGRAIAVLTRADLAPAAQAAGAILTSSRTGAGIARLREAILAAVAGLPDRGTAATARLAVGLDRAALAVTAALEAARAAAAGAAIDEAVVASDVRRAVDALAAVTGASVDADLIDRIFSRHCIGK